MRTFLRLAAVLLSCALPALAAKPSITSVIPGTLQQGSGSVLGVLGTGFTNGAVVNVNGTPEPTVVLTSGILGAWLPSAPQTVSITVTNAGGAVSKAFAVKVKPLPANPTQPTQPSAPTQPTTPTQPVQPTQPSSPTTDSPTPSTGRTFYIRADGGGRYSPGRVSWGFGGKDIGCDGQGDTSYAAAVAAAGGATTNLHCAFNDYRFLWDDQTGYNTFNVAWQGGDTIILDNTVPWRVGWDTDGSHGSDVWCRGYDPGAFGCTNQPVPSGTPTQHTRILGRNWANCSVGNQPDKTKMSQIYGGHGVWDALNLGGAQYVDVQCIELTRHSNCVTNGYPTLPSNCSRSIPIDDYDSDGIGTDVNTHDVLLQDMWIHGHTDRGIKGPIGGLVTATRVDIAFNGMANWDLDDGNGTPSPNGSLKWDYVTIEWGGCNQEYPAVSPIPVTACYSQSSGGYGDGVGTPQTTFGSVSINHSIFRYNTQDGEDFGHILSSPSLSITNSLSYGNNGGGFKWAGFQNVTFENNLAVANCLRMSAPITGAPSTYNANLSDFCRANDAISFDVGNNAVVNVANNSIVTYAPTTFDLACYDGATCANSTINFTNNVILGYQNPTTWNMGGQAGGVGLFCLNGCNGSTLPIGHINRASNTYWGIRGNCPAVGTEQCADPLFVNEPPTFSSEAVLGAFNFALSGGSAALYHGIPVTGLSVDYLGNSFHQPPSAGALEYGSAFSLPTP